MKQGVFDGIDAVYSSQEGEAFSTASIIADLIGKRVSKMSNFNELERDNTVFSENHNQMVERAFSNLEQSEHGWEPRRDTLDRFLTDIRVLNHRPENNRILVVSHGIVLTLCFAYLKKEMDNLFSRWKKLRFLSYGIVKDSEVLKDIVE